MRPDYFEDDFVDDPPVDRTDAGVLHEQASPIDESCRQCDRGAVIETEQDGTPLCHRHYDQHVQYNHNATEYWELLRDRGRRRQPDRNRLRA